MYWNENINLKKEINNLKKDNKNINNKILNIEKKLQNVLNSKIKNDILVNAETKKIN